MTLGKASAVTAGLAGALVVGIWIGTAIDHHEPVVQQGDTAAVSRPATPAVNMKRTTPERTRLKAIPQAKRVSLSSPLLRARLQPLLNDGIDMDLAAKGFHDAGEFATVAHAAHNLQIPFILLQHRVLDEHMTLAQAITKSRPGLNGAVEAARARAEAASDLAML